MQLFLSVGICCCENPQSWVGSPLVWCRRDIPLFWVAPRQGAQAWTCDKTQYVLPDPFSANQKNGLGGERVTKMRGRGGGGWRRNNLVVSTLCFSLEIQFRLVMFVSLGYLDCWRRDYKINSETTGTIHETAAMTTVGYFPRATWEMQRKTLYCTAKYRRMLLWDWSHNSLPRSCNHILPFTYFYYTRYRFDYSVSKYPISLKLMNMTCLEIWRTNRLNIIHIKLIKRRKIIYILITEFQSSRRQLENWSLMSIDWESRLKRELSLKTGRGMTFIAGSLNLKATNLVGRNPLFTVHQLVLSTWGFCCCSEEIHVDGIKSCLYPGKHEKSHITLVKQTHTMVILKITR